VRLYQAFVASNDTTEGNCAATAKSSRLIQRRLASWPFPAGFRGLQVARRWAGTRILGQLGIDAFAPKAEI
jgi:hypothetical protein